MSAKLDGNITRPPIPDTDEQTLTLVGGNQLVLSPGATGGGGSVTFNTTPRTIYSEEYFARSANGTTQSGNRQLTVVRTAVGRWTATLAPPHPDGVNYHTSFTAEEQSGNRDTPDITVVQGTQAAAGFQFQITTGDNGGTADAYVDTPFTIGIAAPVTVLTGVSLA